MSLLHRISSNETFSSQRGRSPAGSQRAKQLSFSPFPGDWEPPVTKTKDSAYEVSKGKRIGRFTFQPNLTLMGNNFDLDQIVQVAVAVFYCLFAAGVVFGYAALKPVLIHEHVYRDLCTQDELDRKVRTCYEQEIRLNLMFTIAAVGTNVAALPIGAILDAYGPKVCGIIGSILLVVGAVLFSMAPELAFDAYIPGYLFLALGGPFIFISSFQLSNCFPKHSGLILALLTGAFDSSSAVFLIYRMLYQYTSYTFTPKKFFSIYLIVPVFILLVQIVLMPSQSYKTVGELVQDVDDQMDEHTALLREEGDISAPKNKPSSIASFENKKVREEERKKEISGIWGVLHHASIKKQILSPYFILITLFTVIQMTRINFFVATIRPQYEYLLHSYPAAVRINTFFDLALPLGGILSIPFIGMVLDNTSTVFILASLVTIATTIGVLGMLPYTWAAYTNICLFVLYRPFYYTAVSDYAAKVFGFRTFGTVYGLIICLAGLGNFSQSGLDALLHKRFGGNPVPVNGILMASALVVGLALVLFIAFRTAKIRRDGLEREAERAEEVMIPSVASP
jgi:MFS family permease